MFAKRENGRFVIFRRLSLYCYWVEIENAIADDKWQWETQTSPQIRERHRTGRYWVGVKLNLYKNLIIEHCHEVIFFRFSFNMYQRKCHFE